MRASEIRIYFHSLIALTLLVSPTIIMLGCCLSGSHQISHQLRFIFVCFRLYIPAQ